MFSNALQEDLKVDRALHEDIATETYEQCQKLMYQYVWKFYTLYKGDFNDWVSEGHEIFMKCLHTYNNEYAFTTWFAYKLQKGFISAIRKKLQQPQPKITFDSELAENQNHTYEPAIFTNYEQVSDTAWTMWQVLLYPPLELHNEIDADDPDNTLDAITWYCTTKLQWTKTQVLESLAELWECSKL